MLKKEIKNNIKMTIYKMVNIATLLYGTESWTVLKRYGSEIAGREMWYCRQTRRDRMRNSQIWGILNEVPAT